MAEPSVDELKKAIKGILKGADLDSLSAKKVRKMLEEKFDADFSARKKEIDKLVMKMITENEAEEESESNDDDQNGMSGNDAESEEEEVPAKKPKKSASSSKSKSDSSSKPKKKKSASKADDSEDPVMSSIREMDDEDLAKKLQEEESGLRRRAARGAQPKQKKERDPNKPKKPSVYSRPCNLSAELAAVVGTDEMPRPEVVKTLWSIVKERNLQDPENKQFMLCDAQMEKLFGIKRVKLFGMMKYLKTHIHDKPR